MIDTVAMSKASIGNRGYSGTLKGLCRFGSLFRSLIKAIMDKMYKLSAPNTEIVMISAVLSVNSAIIPTPKLNKSAAMGVLNLGEIFPRKKEQI